MIGSINSCFWVFLIRNIQLLGSKIYTNTVFKSGRLTSLWQYTLWSFNRSGRLMFLRNYAWWLLNRSGRQIDTGEYMKVKQTFPENIKFKKRDYHFQTEVVLPLFEKDNSKQFKYWFSQFFHQKDIFFNFWSEISKTWGFQKCITCVMKVLRK